MNGPIDTHGEETYWHREKKKLVKEIIPENTANLLKHIYRFKVRKKIQRKPQTQNIIIKLLKPNIRQISPEQPGVRGWWGRHIIYSSVI